MKVLRIFGSWKQNWHESQTLKSNSAILFSFYIKYAREKCWKTFFVLILGVPILFKK